MKDHSQKLTKMTAIAGGPVGYQLALNSFAIEIVHPSERTATIGRLTGVAYFGTAIGYLAGGLLSDWFEVITPFRVALTLFCISTIYSALVLPSLVDAEAKTEKASKSLSNFFEPLKMFTPRKWMLKDGTLRREYGVLLLGIGAFMAVFATVRSMAKMVLSRDNEVQMPSKPRLRPSSPCLC